MDYYLISPTLTWLVCSSTNLPINSTKTERFTFDPTRYMRLRSHHGAIVKNMVSLMAFMEVNSALAFKRIR